MGSFLFEPFDLDFSHEGRPRGSGMFSKQVRHAASTFEGVKVGVGGAGGGRPSRLMGLHGVLPPEFFLEILEAESCIFVHPESLDALQLWKNFNDWAKLGEARANASMAPPPMYIHTCFNNRLILCNVRYKMRHINDIIAIKRPEFKAMFCSLYSIKMLSESYFLFDKATTDVTHTVSIKVE